MREAGSLRRPGLFASVSLVSSAVVWRRGVLSLGRGDVAAIAHVGVTSPGQDGDGNQDRRRAEGGQRGRGQAHQGRSRELATSAGATSRSSARSPRPTSTSSTRSRPSSRSTPSASTKRAARDRHFDTAGRPRPGRRARTIWSRERRPRIDRRTRGLSRPQSRRSGKPRPRSKRGCATAPRRSTELKAQRARARCAARQPRQGDEGAEERLASPGERCVGVPVQGPRAFSNDWGNPRSGGRRHKGTDIFARTGTPVVAPVAGTSSPRTGGLGGKAVLPARRRRQHLLRRAPQPLRRRRVGCAQGQIVGYVGTSGNARGGPAHLHFEIHPGNGAPVNPYGTLRTYC